MHDAAMWHSPDGLAWREIGPTAWEDDVVGPWAGGALVAERDGRDGSPCGTARACGSCP